MELPFHPRRTALQAYRRKYIPKPDDLVIGIIKQKTGEQYKVDIRAPFEATLDSTAFERATKRHKPNLQVGHVVYAFVQSAHKDYETTLVCTSVDVHKDWTSGEGYLGQLQGGYCLDLDFIAHADCLLGDECFVLEQLGAVVKYEVAVGRNGRIWVKTERPKETLLVLSAIKTALTKALTLEQTQAAINIFVERLT
ncbi:unnamed protein product [Vitrella brassicaformis CCMP3155]|uniref:K Homology domain-containing protein n=2 Tax=Vitrella brassicaformis TaxID=1169539 RepID=A0A0G4G1A1_VITBC|nr:unnamed protein product [Vitrella brassicaformis CCMP3155]|eukprot:CEM21263.1 unnamed protein product [Vitrella brassicaformis CCMP3155]